MTQLAPHVKVKIGSHLSYPVKFSEMCELLAPAMEQLGIEVWFRDWKPPRQNEVRESYAVVEARYSPQRDPAWQIFATPIPRSLRGSIHTLLLPVLFGRVRSWLLAERASGWYSTDHSLRIRYRSALQKLEIDEHNAA